jgi:hypothetical protein
MLASITRLQSPLDFLLHQIFVAVVLKYTVSRRRCDGVDSIGIEDIKVEILLPSSGSSQAKNQQDATNKLALFFHPEDGAILPSEM